jgi:hypothetical protein
VRCKVLLVDQNGLVDVSPSVERTATEATGLWAALAATVGIGGTGLIAGSVALAAAGAALAGGLLAAGYAGRYLARTSLSRRVARAATRAGEPVEIVRASGIARVRGRVHVLSPVVEPHGRQAAAFVTRKVVGVGGRVTVQHSEDSARVRVEGDGMVHEHKGAVIEQSSRCGRFLVWDGTGVAVVDDDAFDVWVAPGSAVPMGTAYSVVVAEGDLVEIIGPCAERPAAEDERAPEASYRSRATVLAFDGRPEERVLILACGGQRLATSRA